MLADEAGAELQESLQDVDRPNREALLSLPVGLHEGIPAETYHARVLGFAGKGALDLVERAPAIYKAWVDGVRGRKETPALAFGKALHMAAVEPALFRATYVVEPAWGDCRKADNKKRRDDWRLEHQDAITVSDEDFRRLNGMIASVLRHKEAGPIMAAARSELTAVWPDPQTGLSCKCRPDSYVDDFEVVADLKSTMDASPDAFARSVEEYRYHVQEPWYCGGLESTGHGARRFLFIACEKEPPYLCAVYELDKEDTAQGREAAKRNLDRLARCLFLNQWPGYPDNITPLSRPSWARRKAA